MTTDDDSATPAKERSERSVLGPRRRHRTCAGCGKHADADELVRVVLEPSSGELAVDVASSAFGRGAHVHGGLTCLKTALKSGFSRVFKTQVKGDVDALAAAIVEAADRRIEGLLSGAKRGGQLAIGADAVKEAKEPALFVVARDAAAAAKLTIVERAVAEGKAIAFADKIRLGALVGGRDGNREVAVIAILHRGVGAAVAKTYGLSAPFRRNEEVWSSSEVR